jgi:hypothetical protein
MHEDKSDIVHIATYFPNGDEYGSIHAQPSRIMWHDNSTANNCVRNLLFVDRDSEIDWFKNRYITEIEDLSKIFGSSPEFLWGCILLPK